MTKPVSIYNIDVSKEFIDNGREVASFIWDKSNELAWKAKPGVLNGSLPIANCKLVWRIRGNKLIAWVEGNFFIMGFVRYFTLPLISDFEWLWEEILAAYQRFLSENGLSMGDVFND